MSNDIKKEVKKEALIELIEHWINNLDQPYRDATLLKSPLYCAEMDGYKHALEDVLNYLRKSE
jgi:hypothetical protein